MTQIVALALFLLISLFNQPVSLLSEETVDKDWLKKEALEVGLPETATWQEVDKAWKDEDEGFLQSMETSREKYCKGEKPRKLGKEEESRCEKFLSGLPPEGTRDEWSSLGIDPVIKNAGGHTWEKGHAWGKSWEEKGVFRKLPSSGSCPKANTQL